MRTLIYLGRYARQPRSEMIDLPLSELNMWAEETAEMLRQEESTARAMREQE